jgi:hypothetical protein
VPAAVKVELGGLMQTGALDRIDITAVARRLGYGITKDSDGGRIACPVSDHESAESENLN